MSYPPWRVLAYSLYGLSGVTPDSFLGVTVWFDYTHHLGFADIAKFSPMDPPEGPLLSLTCSFTLPRATASILPHANS